MKQELPSLNSNINEAHSREKDCNEQYQNALEAEKAVSHQ